MGRITRRDFLKAAPATAGVAALVAAGRAHRVTGTDAPDKTATNGGDVRILGAAYTPNADYPVRPQRYSDVTVKDSFWKPKIAINAAVTIPFQAKRLADGGGGLAGNVLEAAILSLKTHPNAQLQGQVEASIRALKEAKAGGNSGFEVAATYYNTTGKR